MLRKSSGTVEERFFFHVEQSDGCWEWKGPFRGFAAFDNGKRYGLFTCDGQRLAAHRAAWMIYFGAIPAGLHVLHRCDNRPCVRPDHLFLGTRHDNMMDCASKGRHPMQLYPERSSLKRFDHKSLRGERNSHARLTEETIKHIRALITAGSTANNVAEQFEITPHHVRAIVRRVAWSHVDG